MSNPSKIKGTRAESNVVKLLKDHGLKAERRALNGSNDKGDILISTDRGDLVLEVKSGKQTLNYNRKTKEEWLRQTKVEAKNAELPCFLVIVKYQRSIKDAEVWDEAGSRFWFLDSFVNQVLVR